MTQTFKAINVSFAFVASKVCFIKCLKQTPQQTVAGLPMWHDEQKNTLSKDRKKENPWWSEWICKLIDCWITLLFQHLLYAIFDFGGYKM